MGKRRDEQANEQPKSVVESGIYRIVNRYESQIGVVGRARLRVSKIWIVK